MALFEVEHPAAREITMIMRAAELCLGKSDLMPLFTKLKYRSPLETESGAAILHIANWDTNNMSTIQVPIFSTLESNLTVTTEEGKQLTGARIVVVDFLGQPFKIEVDELEQKIPAPYIQFDLIPEGLVFTAETEVAPVLKYGIFESDLYFGLAATLRNQASLDELFEASQHFLDQAA